ncbi:hypothetical protein QLX08_011043 [Tetragonisca angustula]|uniref:Uncharacterized protein n=1 Tax=Tetragonisca angustula TaxID=166442 RepID=A0AAW0Z9Z4_9HYME
MHLILTFGFSISTKSNSNLENDKDTNKDKVKKRKVRQHKEKEISKNEFEITQSSENFIHIYIENGDFCLRPIVCPIKKDTYWVVFSVHHLVHLNEMQLKKFFNYIIICKIFCGKQKFSERAKKDKVKGFYINNKSIHVGREEFLELYHSNSTKRSSPLLLQTIITDEIYGDFSMTTYFDVIPDSIHEYLFRKMLRKGFPTEPLMFGLFNINSIEDEVKSSSKQVKKSQVKRNKKEKQKQGIETYEIRLPAEVLFSDMGTITTYNRNTLQLPCISSILMYTQCQNILSDKQLRMNLNPISIKLQKLSNFPADVIIENGFKYLYLKIFFVDRTIITPCYIPEKMMYFEFIKCFLCEEFRPKELINFLATKFLTIEVIGIRIIESLTSTSNQSDYEKSISKLLEAPTKEEILLGVVEFDVSDLLRGFWEVKLTNNLIHPRNRFVTHTHYKNDETIKISWENSPLPTDIFTLYNTSMKIKIHPAYDLRIVQKKIIQDENMWNRIFFNLNNLELANDILKDVSFYNSNLLTIYESSKESNNSKVQNILKHVLTGFAIENCEKCYIFIEGLSNGYLLKIWEKVKKFPIQHKCIYYNSNYIFLARLYEDFMFLGTVIHIKLSESLEMQLRKCNLYIGKTKATLQSNIIRKLGLMNLTLTMKSLCQTRLFPKSDDVKAFIDDIRKIHFATTV